MSASDSSVRPVTVLEPPGAAAEVAKWMSNAVVQKSLDELSLAELEATIAQWQRGYAEAGKALKKIRDDQLYKKVGFQTFVEYAESHRCDVSRCRAYQLIEAAEVAVLFNTLNILPPRNARQAWELHPLLRKAGKDAVVKLWSDLRDQHGDTLTANIIKAAVAVRMRGDLQDGPQAKDDTLGPLSSRAMNRLIMNAFVTLSKLAGCTDEMLEMAMTEQVASFVAKAWDAVETVKRVRKVAVRRADALELDAFMRDQPDLRTFVHRNDGFSLQKSSAVAGELKGLMRDAHGRPTGLVHPKAGKSAEKMAQLAHEAGYRTSDGDPIEEGNITHVLATGGWVKITPGIPEEVFQG